MRVVWEVSTFLTKTKIYALPFGSKPQTALVHRSGRHWNLLHFEVHAFYSSLNGSNYVIASANLRNMRKYNSSLSWTRHKYMGVKPTWLGSFIFSWKGKLFALTKWTKTQLQNALQWWFISLDRVLDFENSSSNKTEKSCRDLKVPKTSM